MDDIQPSECKIFIVHVQCYNKHEHQQESFVEGGWFLSTMGVGIEELSNFCVLDRRS